MDFEKLNNDLYYKSSHYKFAKKPTDFDNGYMKISDWINDLCWYYISKRKQLDNDMDLEFNKLIEEQKKKITVLDDSEYKSGLLKAVEDVKL